MIDSEVATRILLEVMSGKSSSRDDSPEEKEFRKNVSEDVDKIVESGGQVEIPKEWLHLEE